MSLNLLICLLMISFFLIPLASVAAMDANMTEPHVEKENSVTVDDAMSSKEMRRILQQAAMSGDAAGLAEVLRMLGKLPGRDATAAVLSTAASLSRSQADDVYWYLLQGVAGFKGADAFTEMGEFVVRYKSKPVSRDLLNSLRKTRSKYVNRVIRRVLEYCPQDMQIMAVDVAAEIPVRRTVDVLMPILAREDAKEKGGKKPPTE
ncbi:MAG: hypothetical protein GWP41_10615 [Planctomycetia bacterium]|nr:hypothetical protein [Planctomycetia bacterium]